jgi:hypothetical protein
MKEGNCKARIINLPHRKMIRMLAFIVTGLLGDSLAGASTLDIYGELVGKTILIAPGVPSISDSVSANLPADKTNAIAIIEGELARNSIAVVQDGPHFVRLLPQKDRDTFLKEVPPRGNEVQSSAGQEILPSGTANFVQTDLAQILTIYCDLSRRTVLRPAILPYPSIHLKTTCPLTRQELAYALATLLGLNGIAVVNDGESFIQLVPMALREQVKCQAPKREPNAKLFDPKQIRPVGVWPPLAPTSKVEREFERLRRAFYAFINYKGPPARPAFHLLELYAELQDKTALASKQFDGANIWFQIQTPLSKRELIYAIETTFRLNNLAIIRVDEQKIRLGHIGETGLDTQKQGAEPPAKP